MSERFTQWLLNKRWPTLVVLALATILAAFSATRLEFDSSIESWFIEDDPSLAAYDEFTRLFRADQLIVVGLFTPNVLDPAVLAIVEQITDEAEQLDNVDRVQSVSNSPVARRLGVGAPELRGELIASPLLTNSLIGPEAAAIVIYYAREGQSFSDKRTFVAALEDIVQRAVPDSVDVAISGGPFIGDAANERNGRDLRVLIPLMLVAIVAIAWLVFRDIRLTLLPLGVVALAVTWAFGAMSALGWPMSMVSAILIPLILAVGVAHSIHIVAGYRLAVSGGSAAREAVVQAMGRLMRPCLYTAITTTAGLLSLTVSELAPIREFAVTAAVGVVSAFIASVTLLPVMLSMSPATPAADTTANPFQHLLERIHDVGSRRAVLISVGGLFVAMAFFWLSTRAEAELDPMIWIPHDDPIRLDAERIDAAFGGALSLELLLGADDGSLDSPAALRQIDEFEQWLTSNTPIARTTSVADLVKEAARVAREGRVEDYALPRSPFLTDSLLERLRDEDQLGPWVNAEFTRARISARAPLTSAQALVDEFSQIEARAAEHFGESRIEVRLTGNAVLTGQMQSNLIQSQLYSFSVALAVVSLTMIVLLRSLVFGLLAMLPNLLPILIGLGAMPLFGIALNPATVMIAAVALGIVVDDTVHIMTALRRRLEDGANLDTAIRSTIIEVGRPVVITSLLLAVGFALLLFGSFLPSRQIGGLVAIIVIAALITDLLILPAMLKLLAKPMATER